MYDNLAIIIDGCQAGGVFFGNMNKVWTIVLVVIVLGGLIGGGAWYFTKNQESRIKNEGLEQVNQVPDLKTNDTTGEVAAELVSGRTIEVTIEGNSFKFTPNVIKAKKEDTVRLIFKSTGAIHNLVIDEFGVETNKIGDGEEEEAEFVVDKTGTFEFYCSVGNHREVGMVGKLIVE